MEVSFGMWDLGQKLTLESFQLSMVVTFLTGRPNLSQSSITLRKLSHFEKCKQQKKVSDNPLHNYLEIYKVSVQFPFTTSKMELHI